MFIEYDGILFFTRKLSISAKQVYFFRLDLGKIKVCGDKMECVPS